MASVGDNCVDRYLEEGIGFPGGSAVNAAVFAARLGVDSAYHGIVGSDAEGQGIVDALRAEGVDVSWVRVSDEPTSITDIRIDEDGNRVFTAYVPPMSHVVLGDAELEALAGHDWIHTGHSSRTLAQIPALSRLAPVVFDFSYTSVETASDVVDHLAIAAFSRETESEEACFALARDAVERGARIAVVTRGARGAIATDGRTNHTQAVAPVDVVDTTGAGDAFQTAFARAAFSGASIPDALEAATAFAATVCTYRGAFGHPTPLEEKEVLRDR
ncbi:MULTISPECIES: PfkB family carbohydrate kinase [unclassified Microbacterium]|uniref:PfkB family carbohydrate kinase n=1 Tax=unclassified Microbacterium TaxID=2609290 RepID=UPI0030197D03